MAKGKNKSGRRAIKANPEDIKAMADYVRMQMSLIKFGFIIVPVAAVAVVIILLILFLSGNLH